ncbi:MAG TPA: ABC transporter permease [bacterium]|nr:ABC transporter permease [bacterium]
MRSRIPAIARKETLHILRDWRTLALAFVLPIILLLLFGYAITFDIRDLKLAVADEDQTSYSRALIERFTSSGYFKIVRTVDHPQQLPALLDREQAQIALAIPEGFAKNMERYAGDKIQVMFDGSESNSATIASGYVDAILASFNMDRVSDALGAAGLPTDGIPPVDVRLRIWFNQDLDSTKTIVPGLIAVIMMVIAALLTSLTVVREREMGSLEGLIATPVRRHEILVGKMIPYLVIALLDCGLIAVTGVAVFGVPFAGSVALFAVTALIFAVAGLSIGLLASVVAGNQLLANQIVVLTTMLPSMLLSGFMFPIKSMPLWVQAITYAVPARYFIVITRGIMLKGQPAADMLRPTLFLIVFTVAVMALADARFRKKL